MEEESFIAKTLFGNFKVHIKPDIKLDMNIRKAIQIGYSTPEEYLAMNWNLRSTYTLGDGH
jgi:hypothetical protein